MILYLEAKTSISDLIIDSIEVQLKDGQKAYLTWDESDISRDKEGFSARYKGVYINDVYANERLEELEGIKIVDVNLYTDNDMCEEDFSIIEMVFNDNGKVLSFENCY